MTRITTVILTCLMPALAWPQAYYIPTYDWVPDSAGRPETVGVQPPASTQAGGVLEAYDHRDVRRHQVQFALAVPLAELQGALPPGFVALPSAPGGDTATVTLTFVLDQASWNAGYPITWSTNYAAFQAQALNQSLGRVEVVTLAIEAANPSFVDIANTKHGPGTARLAVLEVETRAEGIAIGFRFELEDEGLGLKVRARATCPRPPNNPFQSDPDPRITRYTAGQVALGATRQAFKGNALTVTLTEAKALAEARDGFLHLPGGSMRLLGLQGPTMLFTQSYEYFRKIVEQ